MSDYDEFGDDLVFDEAALAGFDAIESQAKLVPLQLTSTGLVYTHVSDNDNNNILGSLATKNGGGGGAKGNQYRQNQNQQQKPTTIPLRSVSRPLGPISVPPSKILRPAQPPAPKRQKVERILPNPFVHTALPPATAQVKNGNGVNRGSESMVEEEMPEIIMDEEGGYVASSAVVRPAPVSRSSSTVTRRDSDHHADRLAEAERKELEKLRKENASVRSSTFHFVCEADPYALSNPVSDGDRGSQVKSGASGSGAHE